ncbi:SgcJ/EcaC family oxidoreductase [Nocardiopsis sp. CNT312]|uniref:SgcJ/EcaC family oxidoreductase n=1 Tax=Nocardiopsis sp. CNT312 TaxID=1137268 RepID=UPI00049106FF|nr:SgcJ/EcaC family oxidoreductase [Nocardiopsis sp. CNT312]
MARDTRTSADDKAVREVADSVMRTWAANDADAFAALFEADASLIGDTYMRGREGIRAFMAQGFEGPYKGSSVVVEPLDVRFVRDDVALLVTKGRVEIPGVPAETPGLAFFATCTLVHGSGGWLIAAYQNSKATAEDS